MPKIGAKLRELRLRRKLGVREIAVRSGTSHSTISLIERDKISPSIDTLNAILDALGTTLIVFFSDLKPQLAYKPFYRAADFIEIGNGENISYRMLGLSHPNRQLLVCHESYAPGAGAQQPIMHAAQEAGVIVRGAIELTVDGKTEILQTGDGFYFDSNLPHRFRNVGKESCEIISAVTPPTY
ncbi:cupin domain-containing protein [Bradyrhizobium sp. 23AC]